ncbi:hypothetical protein M3193_07870 [Sporosarcina luteola]|uniref:hypothetical protein n=1 Tax=Sporosarcina luteola TaxID=582850 RepID=UPI00203DA160|nr:hypothetical protein [Sporosarcina luteola]MCM3744058.1 hypothetical protein [Sporosarcina luteola]
MNKKEARKRRRKKKSLMGKAKFLIGAVLLIGIIGSSVSITFANQDIQSLLTNWFNTQRGHAITEIKEAIDTEREIQTERLKEELQAEIQSANERLQSITTEEKEKRTSELRRYTDELINNLEINSSEEEGILRNELEGIFQAAIVEMDRVVINNESSKQEHSSEPETNDEDDFEEGLDPESESELGTEQGNEPAPEHESSSVGESASALKKDRDTE